MASQRDRVIAQLRKRQEEKLLKKESDSLKAKRTYVEEVQMSSPEYKATKAKETEAKRIKAETDLRKAKSETTPQADMLRFGQEQKKFRDLAYKERTLEEDDDEGNTIVSMQYIPREGNELFKQQVEAYGDSLKLASLAQQYGTRTPDVRKIDRNKVNINNEFDKDVERYMEIYKNQNLPPGIDMVSYAKDKATSDLVRKYGKGIIPLLAELKNR